MSLGPTSPKHDELRRLFSRFGKIEREKKIRAKLSFYYVASLGGVYIMCIGITGGRINSKTVKSTSCGVR
uniref:Uncharacterized protein n=1 Tax=Oryza glumipatula TaxID=40148 RepID=A0A0E0AGV3_9ORYZ